MIEMVERRTGRLGSHQPACWRTAARKREGWKTIVAEAQAFLGL